LHRAQEKLEVVPFLDDRSHGVFATRAPARPNRIGLSIVQLQSVQGRVLHFTGNDMLDRTPVLDIKPYVPRFDVRQTDRIGWFAARVDAVTRTRSDDRMG
ncbi:MAG: TrmO family methyltransferase, partial [Burkholderiaceae bacterium]